ncbi:glycosyltransferase [Caballeronia terrestris]|uniref:Glycosyltransferase n=1 Tax=Caballeronia terrestris TaxID=1226301 RepID=A0A158KKB5_9BURK|nr:bacteriohopanetetrol glucosamine biosynthesis glycosyltransferase HpnI [Caballeronia terrestris]SAL81608.1 glycosyltransferase [Caballeronia terrestris]
MGPSLPLAEWILIAICCVATCHAAVAALVRSGLRGARDRKDARNVPVSVLKPLCGAEPRLMQNLESFCMQAHPSYQLLFGVSSASDPSVKVVERLRSLYPHLDIELVIDGTFHGSNRKVGNLINLARRARHDVLVIADSDIAVDPCYLARVTAALAEPGVGIVTCLYRARALGGFWARLGALFIDEWFAPSVHIAHAAGSRCFGFGATLALTRKTLALTGGFEALSNCLADDYRLAERVRALGLATVLSDVVVTTDVVDRGFLSLWRRETRWLRTIRSVNPLGFAFLFITFTSPWLIASGLLGLGIDASGGNIEHSYVDTVVDLSTSLGLSARLLLHWRSARDWRSFWRDLPLVPLRDALLWLQWIAAAFGSNVSWRGVSVPVDGSRAIREAVALSEAESDPS